MVTSSTHVLAAIRGGYFRVDVSAAKAAKVEVDGSQDVEFTAIAVRADRSGKSLRETSGPIHAEAASEAVGSGSEAATGG